MLDPTAKIVNAAWAVTRRRLERERDAADPMAALRRRCDQLERENEHMAAAVCDLARLLAELARVVDERAELGAGAG